MLGSALRSASVEVRHGCEVRSVDPTTGVVDVRAGDDEYSLTAGLVIGADGIGSQVRLCGNFGVRVAGSGHS
jgi:2-polyprenyl-6-methoxyphenol hydroxylase-like FAD-dependent oxidoreductase